MWAERLSKSIVSGLRAAWDFLGQPIPGWLKQICTVVGQIIFALLKEAGKAYIGQIEDKIIEISKTYSELSGDEKFNKVWDFAHTLLPNWPESSIDSLIQNLFIALKRRHRV